MMSDFSFKFVNTVKTLDIGGKIYSIDIGNTDLIKSWTNKAKELSESIKTLDDSDIDSVVILAKDIIQLILGDADEIWGKCGKNIYSMLDLITKLAGFIKESRDTRMSSYGL